MAGPALKLPSAESPRVSSAPQLRIGTHSHAGTSRQRDAAGRVSPLRAQQREHKAAEQPLPLLQGAGIILLRDSCSCDHSGGKELEVLIGQYEVVNALRSDRQQPVMMRFPGEWHMPGGAKRQADFGPLQTACRELQEEFLVGGGTGLELAATLFLKTALEVSVKEGGSWHGGSSAAPEGGGGDSSGGGLHPRPTEEAVGGVGERSRYDVYVFVADISDNAGLQVNRG